MKCTSFEFESFFMGGFECADHINKYGNRVNLQQETAHDLRVFEDYKLLKSVGISVVREGICWSSVEKEPYVFDFSRLKPFYKAAAQLEIQIIWDLCHFGFPTDLVPTHPHFSKRLKALAEAFCQFHLENSNQRLLVIPINEISFLSWLAGEAKGTVPFTKNTGWEIKYELCKAAIIAIKTIKSLLSDVVIISAEPLVKVHASDKFSKNQAQKLHGYQYQAMDILLGKSCPELGGSDDLIDFLGVNYYHNNQWNDAGETLPWPDRENNRIPFSEMLQEIYSRYNLPIIITETGHFSELRSQWLQEICGEVKTAINMGIVIKGICVYPIIARPDWDDLAEWHEVGFWELNSEKERIPNHSYLHEFNRLQNQFSKSHKV